jgi:hypothetical protein
MGKQTSARMMRAALAAGILAAGASPVLAVDYYVSPTGNNSNNGTSTSTPWQTIARVNQVDLNAGDRVFFQGSQSFSGTISITSEDGGTSSSPVVIGSYGTGRATIAAPANAAGIDIFNVGGISVRDLVIQGPGKNSTSGTGISFYTDLANNVKVQFGRIDNVEVFGFRNGIQIGAWNANTGWNDVRITNSIARDNLHSGISTYAQNSNVHTNLYIGACRAYSNTGDPNSTGNTGSGIVIGNANGATVERCVAYNNGIDNKPTEGPVGIWTYYSNNVTIQLNEAYDNKTSNGDGGGFDLDLGVTNSVMQYNYSHDNAGAGYMLWGAGGGNIVRYNISQNDGRSNNIPAAAFTIGGASSGAQVYNNTFYISPTSSGAKPPVVKVINGLATLGFRNNIVIATGGSDLVRAESGATGVSTFQGNNYWTYGGAFNINWGGTNYSSLSAWRATGQEKNGANNTGLNVDPRLWDAGNGGTIGNANNLGNLNAYRLQSGSPMINAGLNLTTSPWSLSVGSRDFYGASIPFGGSYDIGAHEYSNLLANPSFDAENYDTQTPSGWSEWSGNNYNAGYTEAYGGSKFGARHGTHWNGSAYNMYTYQYKNGLANGLYTARVWAKSGGGQTACQFDVKDFGGTRIPVNIPVSSSYQLVEIKNINVTNGQCTVGIWSDAAANQWVYFDEVELVKQ